MNETLNQPYPDESVLITGANGFIGRELCEQMARQRWPVKAVYRSCCSLPANFETVAVGSIDKDTDWAHALEGMQAVIHLAGRAHVVDESPLKALAEFRSVNVDGTLNLARQAAAAGIRRFIFISSIKVNGENTPINQPFTDQDPPMPIDPYGISKYEAETGLRQLSSETGMEVVIIRPPLVYGPGVQGNFLSMMRWLEKNFPLPLGSVHNKRTLIALDNLIDLIVLCITHPAAANQIFLAGDSEDLSTTELLQRLARALGKKSRLFPVPVWLLTVALGPLGKGAIVQKLCGSLRADIGKARRLLSWTPPVGVDDALRKTALAYLGKKR